MASLRKRNEYYYIRFCSVRDGRKRQVAYSLGTTSRDEATYLKLEYEDLYRRGEIDPFNGWSPRKETEAKRHRNWGQYILLGDAIYRFLRMAGLPEEITLHGLRHSCATDLLRKGMSIHLVSQFLGHAQVTTTQIYTHLYEKDIETALKSIE